MGYFWSEIQQRTLDRGDDVEKNMITGTSMKTMTQKRIATRSLSYDRHPCQFSRPVVRPGPRPKHTTLTSSTSTGSNLINTPKLPLFIGFQAQAAPLGCLVSSVRAPFPQNFDVTKAMGSTKSFTDLTDG